MSNGSAAAVATALSLMAAEPSYRHALVAAADVFDSDPAQRWEQHGPRGILPGDGGAAVVIQRTASSQVIRSVATSGRPAIELQFFTGFAPGGSTAPDARRLHPGAVPIMRECVSDGVTQALTESDLDGYDPRIRVVMITRLGQTLLRRVFLPALPKGLPEPLFLSAATGHLGAADQLANITHLREAKLLAPGEFAVLVSVGMGFTATCMIIEEIGWAGDL
jgi:3-oxoacyl-[acyl-carrier-protein] synthase-3